MDLDNTKDTVNQRIHEYAITPEYFPKASL